MAAKKWLIRDVMTAQPHSVRSNDTLAQAKGLMQYFHIRHLPVLNAGGKPIGILSERDINLVGGLEGARLKNMLAADLCHGKPFVVDPQTPLNEVAQAMAKQRYGAAIVMDDCQLLGIFTTVDACRTLGMLLGK